MIRHGPVEEPRGGIDKLGIYKRLGIAEVWFWIAESLAVHRLGANGYEQVTTSTFFPGLDLELLSTAQR